MIHNGEIIHMSDSYDFLNIWPIGDSCKEDCYKQNGVFVQFEPSICMGFWKLTWKQNGLWRSLTSSIFILYLFNKHWGGFNETKSFCTVYCWGSEWYVSGM